MKVAVLIGALIFLLGGWQTTAQAVDNKASRSKPHVSLNDFSWLVGQWQSKEGDTVFEEHWMSPAGGVMIGMGREVKNSKLSFHEYLRLEERVDGIYYLAQPFGKTSTAFKLTKNDDTVSVFENPAHDFPNRIEYSRRKDGSIRVLGSGQENHKVKTFEFALSKIGSR